MGQAKNRGSLEERVKNAKKFRKGEEYGSARWGNSKDIAPYKDEDYRNNGYFSMFLSEMESIALNFGRTIYIESIINPVLKQYVLRYDYLEDRCSTNSFYKIS